MDQKCNQSKKHKTESDRTEVEIYRYTTRDKQMTNGTMETLGIKERGRLQMR